MEAKLTICKLSQLNMYLQSWENIWNKNKEKKAKLGMTRKL